MVLFYVIISIYLLGSVLSIVPSNNFIFKVWNYFHVHLFIKGIALVVVSVILAFTVGPLWLLAFTGACLIAAGWHLIRVWPYNSFASVEVPAEKRLDLEKLSVMSLNVRQKNKQFQRLIDTVLKHKPDILLVYEIDQQWVEALEAICQEYECCCVEGRDDTYGMGMYSRIPYKYAEIEHYSDDQIPAIDAVFSDKNGGYFRLMGLHPYPPGEKLTGENFRQYLSRTVPISGERILPTVVAGDMNEVSWSPFMKQLKEQANLKDPRIGRGTYPTFNAHIPVFQIPIDHILFSGKFNLVELKCMPAVGSDHYPLWAAFQVLDGAVKVDRVAGEEELVNIDPDQIKPEADKLFEEVIE